MSKTYLMGMLQVDNPEGMGPYLEKVQETVANHGGQYLVRLGEVLYSEGDPNPAMVILEFPDSESAMHGKTQTSIRRSCHTVSTTPMVQW